MISAFGVEHGEVSKGLSGGQLRGLSAAAKQGGSRGRYAGARLAAHTKGKAGDIKVGVNNRQVASWYKNEAGERPMTAAYVPMEIDQGEDWTATIVYTDDFDMPYNVIAPCRMDIKNRAGMIQLSLSTPDVDPPPGEIPPIALSGEAGVIQLHIEDSVTSSLVPGSYLYDMFVTISDGNEYAGNQVQRLIRGECTVNQRVTQL